VSTKRREYEYGKIVSVDVVPLGDNLAADVTAGASSITVEDAADFDEDGGQLLLAGTVYAYSTWTEDDATGVGTITLTGSTVAANAFEGDAVAVYDPLYLVAASDKVAQVEVVGDDGNVDMLEAGIALHLVDKLDEGVRGNNGEQVKLELEGDEWVVVDIPGLGDPSASGTLFKRDAMTVAAVGAQTFALAHEPLPDSLHLRWEPINLDDTEWSRVGSVVTIPTPNYFKVGDVLTAKYAYQGGSQGTRDIVSWASAGPNLVVTEGDSTNRSALSFDDSGWTVGPAPLGYPLSQVPGSDWTPAATSIGTSDAGLWIRRAFTLAAAATVQVWGRADGQYWLYMDGTLLDSYTGSAAALWEPGPFSVALAAGRHVVALHVNDDVPDAGAGADYTYGDLRVTT
jgi:hypothetical protein